MPRTIHKFQLHVAGVQYVIMPDVSRILSVQIQNGQPCLWAEVDPSKPMIRRKIIIVGTGHPIPDCHPDFIGTVQQMGGALVWHIYDGGEYLLNGPE